MELLEEEEVPVEDELELESPVPDAPWIWNGPK